MIVKTSYFTKLPILTSLNYTPISICGKAPDWYGGRQYKKFDMEVEEYEDMS